MPKQHTILNQFGGLNSALDPRDIGLFLSKAQNISLSKGGKIRTIGGPIAHGDVPQQAGIIAPGYGLFIFNSTHKDGATAKDTGENWLALCDAANVQIDLYDLTSDSFDAADIDLGTVTTYAPGAGKIDFPTVSTLTDSDSALTTTGTIKEGDIILISGCTTTTANNILIVAEKVVAGTLTTRGSPFTVTAAEAGTVTLTVLMPAVFHWVNEALRVSSASGGAAVTPKHYSYVKRTHFPADAVAYDGWYANAIGPAAPTDLSLTATSGDAAAANLTAGAGFEVGITQNSNSGNWPPAVNTGTIDWECAVSFVYDDGQESALYAPATAETFTTSENNSLDVTVRAKGPYDERISGGRVYCRNEVSDEPWALLVDIDMNKGVRTTLSGGYTAWINSPVTADVVYAGDSAAINIISMGLNIETYEERTGLSPSEIIATFSTANSFWKCSVVAKGRTFIANVKYTDKGGNLVHHRDDVFYSDPLQYDKFPIENRLPLHPGGGDPLQMKYFDERLFIFKEQKLHIVDISSDAPVEWKQEREISGAGVKHPAAVFEVA